LETHQILQELDAEIRRLTEVRNLLAGARESVSANHAKAPKTKTHTMSADGRARIAAAQKKRWAAQKKAASKS
jgi:hypothetical protein